MNPYYQMMINNARNYLRKEHEDPNDVINAFEISQVLAVLTGKLKEDVLQDIIES